MFPITIDMQRCSQDAGLVARKIWQALFKIYRHGGGDLEHMDSLLCDLNILTTFVKEKQRTRSDQRAWWDFSGDYTSLTLYCAGEGYVIDYDVENCTITISAWSC